MHQGNGKLQPNDSMVRPQRLTIDCDKAEQGLVKLVLVVVELLRKLMERQAIRRIDSGRLSQVKIERLASTMMQLEEQMRGLQAHFGINDLDFDLGPLGKVIKS